MQMHMAHFKKLFHTFSLLLILPFLLASCKDEAATIGLDILPAEDLFTGVDSVRFMSAENISPEKIRSNDPFYGILGSVYDPHAGITTASFITQLGLSRPVEKFNQSDDFEVDSVVLSLSYSRNQWFGNKDARFDVKVYKFNEPLSIDEKYYSDMEVEGLYDPVPIGQRVSSAWDELPDSVWDESNYVHNWEIKLNEATTNEIFNLSEEELESNESFQAAFPGIFVEAEPLEPLTPGDGSLVSLSLLAQSSDMRLHFHYFTRDTATNEIKDTIQAEYVFPINRECVRINRFAHDQQRMIDFNNPGTDLLIAQGLAGSYVQFDLRKSRGGPIDFGLWQERLDPDNNSNQYYGISGVNLYFRADTTLHKSETTFYSPVPSDLVIYTRNEAGELEEPVYATGQPSQPTQPWFEPAIYNPLTQRNQAYNPATGEYQFRMVREFFELMIDGQMVTPIDTMKIPQGPFYLASPFPASDAKRVLLMNNSNSSGEEPLTPRVDIKYVTFTKP